VTLKQRETKKSFLPVVGMITKVNQSNKVYDKNVNLFKLNICVKHLLVLLNHKQSFWTISMTLRRIKKFDELSFSFFIQRWTSLCWFSATQQKKTSQKTSQKGQYFFVINWNFVFLLFLFFLNAKQQICQMVKGKSNQNFITWRS